MVRVSIPHISIGSGEQKLFMAKLGVWAGIAEDGPRALSFKSFCWLNLKDRLGKAGPNIEESFHA
jgi:hypothetical protein